MAQTTYGHYKAWDEVVGVKTRPTSVRMLEAGSTAVSKCSGLILENNPNTNFKSEAQNHVNGNLHTAVSNMMGSNVEAILSIVQRDFGQKEAIELSSSWLAALKLGNNTLSTLPQRLPAHPARLLSNIQTPATELKQLARLQSYTPSQVAHILAHSDIHISLQGAISVTSHLVLAITEAFRFASAPVATFKLDSAASDAALVTELLTHI